MVKELDQEEKTSLLLSKYYLSESEKKELEHLFKKHQDWGKVIGILTTHRSIGSAWFTIKDHGLATYGKSSSNYFVKLVESIYCAQRLRGDVHYKNAVNVCGLLEENNINYAVLKGLPLALSLYDDKGMRWSNDCDILINFDQLEEALKVVKSEGYVQGYFDLETNSIIKAKRRDIISSPLLSHEVQPFVKETKDNYITHHPVDIQFSLDLLTNNRTDDMVSEFLNNTINITHNNDMFKSLNWEDHLLFLCIHFYKEAIYVKEVTAYKDFLLYKLIDIYRLLYKKREVLNWASIKEKVSKYDLYTHVFYTFHYVISLFKDSSLVPHNFLEYISNKTDNQILDLVYDEHGESMFCWNLTIPERFFNVNRIQQLIN
ncbi:nucleotidyltransferase family protein [Bacillus sp. MUM 13]|uniref:nucleotidyltransferase family protein n=1 Tax=Bacillus sp. MUM 13 TaxID=1678001 RepID=UPI0008F5E479|nr:nucleotidyltransferase family protein [Bacillus sp. MUM 13]OIK06808.1 hypothetical protein BIV59_21300 [Bacillus sp. MUM 13]